MKITLDLPIEDKIKLDEKVKKELKANIVNQIFTLVTAAFGIVAALAWNEAVKAWLEQFIKAGQGAIALTIYAAAVTVICVVVTMFLGWVKQRVAE